MPLMPVLNQREALQMVKDASADFPGLQTLLLPVVAPRPLTDQYVIQGYVLIVAGAQCRAPWFSCSAVRDYDRLYEDVLTHYCPKWATVEMAAAAGDAENDDASPQERRVLDFPSSASLS